MTLQKSNTLHCLPSVNNAVLNETTAFDNRAHSVNLNTELVKSTSTTSNPHAHKTSQLQQHKLSSFPLTCQKE